MVSEDFRKQISGYGLTTAHILYRRPDHQWLLQSYVWQNYDLFPEFPELHRFLEFYFAPHSLMMKPTQPDTDVRLISFVRRMRPMHRFHEFYLAAHY